MQEIMPKSDLKFANLRKIAKRSCFAVDDDVWAEIGDDDERARAADQILLVAGLKKRATLLHLTLHSGAKIFGSVEQRAH